MENEMNGSIITECFYCLAPIEVPLNAKSFICPKCGEFSEFDAAKMQSRLKMIMRKAFGDKPKKPENN